MTANATKTAIATWFVADKPGEETEFPQVGGKSSTVEFQNTYWRCIVCFFASSLRNNGTETHLLFTNVDPPTVDGINLAELFRDWGVQTVHLPISFRLPAGIGRWGNQLYILDIIKYVAESQCSSNLIVLDCDCVWTTTVKNVSKAISQHGCLTYTLDDEHYAWDASINGATRREMAEVLRRWSSDTGTDSPAEIPNAGYIPYHGGEIFAATKEVCCDLSILIDSLWHWWLKAEPDGRGIKEEAHFLSILYAIRAYSSYTANPFIKRIWTTFHLNNLKPSDRDLAIWHLPAEKKTGFRRLFWEVTGVRREAWAASPLDTYNKMLARFFGIPRRDLKKFFLDVAQKVAEKGRGILRPGPAS